MKVHKGAVRVISFISEHLIGSYATSDSREAWEWASWMARPSSSLLGLGVAFFWPRLWDLSPLCHLAVLAFPFWVFTVNWAELYIVSDFAKKYKDVVDEIDFVGNRVGVTYAAMRSGWCFGGWCDEEGSEGRGKDEGRAVSVSGCEVHQ